MARSVTLTRQAQQRGTVSGLTAYRTVVTASGATGGSGAENELFVHERLPRDPSAPLGQTEDRFLSIATPLDLAELPVNEPNANASPTYFRKATVELWTISQDEADKIWSSIQKDVKALFLALKIADSLTDEEEAEITDD
ncbi:MAG: hypothetical protein E6G97_17815 [Alphaproteobacteria bacterium]|nr:MAG: hypothetical protein E6G97_17815 [Alphaproteobacteria bacterium]